MSVRGGMLACVGSVALFVAANAGYNIGRGNDQGPLWVWLVMLAPFILSFVYLVLAIALSDKGRAR